MSKYLSPKSNKKSITMLVSLILIITIGVGGTLAYLVTHTDPVKNTFTPSQVVISVDEEFDGSTKSDVKIFNHNNSVNAYIRAAIVVNWMDKAGNVWAATPVEDTNYTLELGAGWTKLGDYYYYEGPVPAGESTTDLIKKASPITDAPEDGYYLSIEILAQGIQADGVMNDKVTTPVEDAWGEAAAKAVGAK